MRFWDTSATVLLMVREPRSADTRALLSDDPAMLVWWGTRTECVSALARKTREGGLEPLGHAQARVRLHRLSRSWTEVLPTPRLRALAETLLYRYPLRIADALQLAAASRYRVGDPELGTFVCLDRRLRNAAEAEGFEVLPQVL